MEYDDWTFAQDMQAREAFRLMDTNGDGSLEKDEIVGALEVLRQTGLISAHIGESTVDALFSELDINGDGEISIDEFISSIARETHHGQRDDQFLSYSSTPHGDDEDAHRGSPRLAGLLLGPNGDPIEQTSAPFDPNACGAPSPNAQSNNGGNKRNIDKGRWSARSSLARLPFRRQRRVYAAPTEGGGDTAAVHAALGAEHIGADVPEQQGAGAAAGSPVPTPQAGTATTAVVKQNGAYSMMSLAQSVVLAHRDNSQVALGDDLWLIRPDGTFHKYWDFLVTALILTTLVTLPLALGWDQLHSRLLILNTSVDLIFSADVIKQFFTGYYDEQQRMVLCQKRATARYLRTWFLLDVLSCIPLDLVLSGGDSELARGTKAVKILRLLRMAKLVRLARVSRGFRYLTILAKKLKLEQCVDVRLQEGVMKLARLLLIFLLLVHWLACLQAMMARLQGYPNDSWMTVAQLVGMPIELQYSFACFKALNQLLMIGYENPPAAATACEDLTSVTCRTESWVTAICLVIGALFFALLVSQVSGVLITMRGSRKTYEEKIMMMRDFFRTHKLPGELRTKALEHVETKYRSVGSADNRAFLSELPQALSRDVYLYLHRESLCNVSFLMASSVSFVAELAAELSPSTAFAGDIIFREGSVGDAMYFVERGVVEIVSSAVATHKHVYALIAAGCFFGEGAVILGTRRSAGTRALTTVGLAVLSAQALKRMLVEHGSVLKRLRDIALLRLRRMHFLTGNSTLGFHDADGSMSCAGAEALAEAAAAMSGASTAPGAGVEAEEDSNCCGFEDVQTPATSTTDDDNDGHANPAPHLLNVPPSHQQTGPAHRMDPVDHPDNNDASLQPQTEQTERRRQRQAQQPEYRRRMCGCHGPVCADPLLHLRLGELEEVMPISHGHTPPVELLLDAEDAATPIFQNSGIGSMLQTLAKKKRAKSNNLRDGAETAALPVQDTKTPADHDGRTRTCERKAQPCQLSKAAEEFSMVDNYSRCDINHNNHNNSDNPGGALPGQLPMPDVSRSLGSTERPPSRQSHQRGALPNPTGTLHTPCTIVSPFEALQAEQHLPSVSMGTAAAKTTDAAPQAAAKAERADMAPCTDTATLDEHVERRRGQQHCHHHSLHQRRNHLYQARRNPGELRELPKLRVRGGGNPPSAVSASSSPPPLLTDHHQSNNVSLLETFAADVPVLRRSLAARLSLVQGWQREEQHQQEQRQRALQDQQQRVLQATGSGVVPDVHAFHTPVSLASNFGAGDTPSNGGIAADSTASVSVTDAAAVAAVAAAVQQFEHVALAQRGSLMFQTQAAALRTLQRPATELQPTTAGES